MRIKELCKKAHQNALEKGFWDVDKHVKEFEKAYKDYGRSLKKEKGNFILGVCDGLTNAFMTQKLMLIVTELGEAVEALRKNDKDNFEEELADTCIRIFDLCGSLGIDLEKAITEKMVRNEKRPYKHGKQF